MGEIVLALITLAAQNGNLRVDSHAITVLVHFGLYGVRVFTLIHVLLIGIVVLLIVGADVIHAKHAVAVLHVLAVFLNYPAILFQSISKRQLFYSRKSNE